MVTLTCEGIHSYSVGVVESFLAVALVLVQNKPMAMDGQTLRRESGGDTLIIQVDARIS